MPTATFPEILMGFSSINAMRTKLALSVPEIIGGTLKILAVLGYEHVLFSLNFLLAFVRMTL